MNRRLTLKKESLISLDTDELASIAGGTATATCGCTSGLTAGVSCGGVCSVNCGNTFGCPSKIIDLVQTF